MAIPSRQIGWSTQSNLLWQISKQLERLIEVRSNTTTTLPINFDFTSTNWGFTDQAGFEAAVGYSVTNFSLVNGRVKCLFADSTAYLNLYTKNIVSFEKVPAYLNQLGIGFNELNALPILPNSINNLDLTYNQFTSIPIEVINLVNLTFLNVYQNQLTSLPIEIANLINLTWLGVGSNQLTSIPSELGNLVNLNSLNLGYNQLTSIFVEIGNLINLTWLDVVANQLTSLPTLPSSIITLYAGSNQLKAFTQTLPNCTALDLGYNQMTLQDYTDSIPFFNLLPNGGTSFFGGNIDSIAGTAAEALLYSKGWSVNI